MSQESSQRRTTICLFSFHPLLPSEFERVLPDDGFRLLIRRLDPDQPFDPATLPVPRASVYAVEGHRRPEVTEALAGAIVSGHAGARVLVVAEKFVEATAFPLLRLGIKGLLTYSDVSSKLPRAVCVIAEAGFWVPRTLLSRFVESTLGSARRPHPMLTARRLSRREREVLELLLQNLSNKEIAGELHISARTAKFHVSNLLAKHSVRRRADLILLAHARSDA